MATFGAPQTADKRGQSSHQTEARTAATRSGSLSIGLRPAWGMVFNTRFGPSSPLVTSADSADPQMPVPRGRLRSVFPTLLNGERSTWRVTVMFLLGPATAAASFGAFARVMHRTQMSRRRLIKSLQLISVGACCLKQR